MPYTFRMSFSPTAVAKIETLLSEGDGTQEEAGVQGSAKTETKKDDEGSQKTDKSTSKSSGNNQSTSESIISESVSR